MSEPFSERPLIDLADLVMGQSPDSQHVYDDLDHGMPFLQGNAEFGDAHPHPVYSCSQPARACNKNDVLISVRAPVGEINVADADYCIGRGLAAIRFRDIPATLGAKLVFKFSPALKRVAQGTTFEAIGKNELASLGVLVPPSSEWEKIAQILDTLDTQIRQTEALIAKLERIKQGLLTDLLTRGIDQNGQLRPTPDQAPHLYKDSPLGRIPREWELNALSQLAETYAGGTPARDVPRFFGGSIPWVKSTEVNQESVNATEECISQAGLEASSAKWVPANVPLIAMYGATAGAVSWLGIRATTNQAVLAVIPAKGKAQGRWLYWALKFASERLLASVQGSGQPNLSKGVTDGLCIAVPADLSEQERIAEIVDGNNERILREKALLSTLSEVKAGLMDDLLTGRVRVTPLLDTAERMPA